MKVEQEIQRLSLNTEILENCETELNKRRNLINQLNEKRKRKLQDLKQQLEQKQIEACICQDDIYVEGHSIEKPSNRSKPKSRSQSQYQPSTLFVAEVNEDKNKGIGDIDRMTFDKKFKNYLNNKEKFQLLAKKRQQIIMEQRKKSKQGISSQQLSNFQQQYEQLLQNIENMGEEFYQNGQEMIEAYQQIIQGRKNKKGVELFYAQKFQYIFRAVQFESLLQIKSQQEEEGEEGEQKQCISKQLLLNYLFDQPMVMMLYSINPYLAADEIADFQTKTPSLLSFEQFSSFLLLDRQPTYFEYSEQNLNEARQIGRGLKCSPIVGKWIDESHIFETILQIFNSVDMLGNQTAERNVLVKKLTLELKKKRWLDIEVIEIVNINKLVPLNRLLYELEHEKNGNQFITKKQFVSFLQNYKRKDTPQKDKLITKLIMNGKYESSYVYVVNPNVLEFLKQVFNAMEKFAEYFVPKQKYIEKVVKHKNYQSFSQLWVRAQPNRYIQKQTVEQTLMRMFNQADIYIDIEEILDFFTNRGRPSVVQYHVYLANLEKQLQKIEEQEQLKKKKAEQTGEDVSTSSDEQFEKQIKRKQKQRKFKKLDDIHKNFKYQVGKKFNVTIPVAFGFDKRDKQKKTSIREQKLKQMLVDKKQQEDQSLKPFQIKQIPRHVKLPLYEKMLKEKQKQRLERLERFRLQIQKSMVPLPERLTQPLSRNVKANYEKQAYQFVAKPMPWYCEINLLDRINKQKQQRRERILQQILNRHHDNDLPQGVLKMLQRNEELAQKRQKNRSVSTTSIGECTFNPKISEYIPDFKTIHERLNVDLQIAKENKEVVHPQPFSFENREKKSRSHMSCVPVAQNQLKFSRQYIRNENEQIEIKPTLKFIGLLEKRKEEREEQHRKQLQQKEKNQIRILRQQKFAPQVLKVLKRNQNALQQSRKVALEKIKLFQQEQKKKAREYENKMIQIYTKVWNRPLLIQGDNLGTNIIENNACFDSENQNNTYEAPGFENKKMKQTALRDTRPGQDAVLRNQYEDKRRRNIEQPPGQYVIENSDENFDEINQGHEGQYEHYEQGEYGYDEGHYQDDDDDDEDYYQNSGVRTS